MTLSFLVADGKMHETKFFKFNLCDDRDLVKGSIGVELGEKCKNQ